MQISSLHTFVIEDGTETPPVRVSVTYHNGRVATGTIQIHETNDDKPSFFGGKENGRHHLSGGVKGDGAGEAGKEEAKGDAVPGMHEDLSGYERLWPR